MLFGYYTLLSFLLFGHIALWIALFNRTHALCIPRRWIRVSELTQILTAVGLCIYIAWRFQQVAAEGMSLINLVEQLGWIAIYAVPCYGFAIWTIASWGHLRWYVQRPIQLLSNDTEMIDVAKQLGSLPMRGWSTRLWACLPMNQMFDLCVNVKTVRIPRLPAELDGLTITHLSDLHYTGKVTRPFFDYVIDRAQMLNSDLIAITGDIMDVEECYQWLQPTLGRLRARHGILYVLGNHDKRLRDVLRLRRELQQLGLVDVACAPHFARIGTESILFSGNELPWFGPVTEPPPREKEMSLRILLSHSPDQLPWAKKYDFDLMLAGHTHGGHIRIPLIGPVVCPSRYGVKFAAGTFFEAPTILHVSRGISGVDPLRFNCPPELTQLVLRTAGKE